MCAWVTSMSRYGIIVAEDGDDVFSDKIKRLDSGKKQFKYRKIIDFKFPVPAIALNTNWNKTIQAYFFEDQRSLGFIPAYEYYVQAFNGNWGIPIIASPQSYEGSIPEFPFFKTAEWVTDKYFNIRLFINNQTNPIVPSTAYPAYEATLRLIITFDNLATL
jgi:hypothetical protein